MDLKYDLEDAARYVVRSLLTLPFKAVDLAVGVTRKGAETIDDRVLDRNGLLMQVVTDDRGITTEYGSCYF